MSSIPDIDIRPDHWDIVRTILQKHVPQYEVWAFGSRAKWAAKDFSDLDLAIITDEPLPEGVSAALTEAFDDSDLPYTVDIVDWPSISKEFRKKIQDNYKEILRKENLKIEFLEVGKLCEFIVDCVNKTAQTVSHRTPFRMVRTTNIRNNRVDLADCKFVVESVYEQWTRRAKIAKGDILLTREAPIGEVGLVNDPDGLFLGQRIMQYRPDKNKVIPRYLYYAFLSPTVKHQLRKFDGDGSVVSHIPVGECDKFIIPVHAKEKQRAIAYILGTLDDKIELNRQMNETLEFMARAIFKDWFVDFGPVRAKAEGRQPEGMSAEVVRLFPEQFNETNIPSGWAISSIGSEVTVVGGGTPSTKEESYWIPPEFDWVTPKDLSRLDSPVLLKTERKISRLGMENISSGLLPNGTVLLSSRAPIGYLAVTEIPVAINQGFIALLCDKTIPNLYVLFWCQTHLQEIINNANGSTFQEISKANFRPIPIIIPQENILKHYTHMVAPWYRRIVKNIEENISLTQLRDTLLPKLISGELRIKDAEKFVAEAI